MWRESSAVVACCLVLEQCDEELISGTALAATLTGQ
jgi:hypothetical protein